MKPAIWVRIAALTVVFVISAAAQKAGQGQQQPTPTPTPPAGGGAGNIPPGGGGRQQPGIPSQQPQPGDRNQQTPFPEMQRPVFFSGKVMLDDGTPPPDPVVIERVCNGVARPEAYTDSKGRFQFQLGQNNTAMMADASVSGSAADPSFGRAGGFGGTQSRNMGGIGGFSERDLMGCELRVNAPGFRSDIVNLAGRRAFDNPDLGTIVLHRLGNVEGTTISATSLAAPKDAKKAFDKGRDALKKNKIADAQKELQKAVQIYPKYATAWFDLGRVAEQQKNVEEAKKDYEQALAADPKYTSPYLQLALLAARENKWQDVADTTDRVLKLDPFSYPQAYFYNSVANYNLKKFDAAEKSAREAQKLDTQHRFPRVVHLLGIILADKRDYNGAAEQLRNYLKFAPAAQDAATVRTQLAEIEKLATQKP